MEDSNKLFVFEKKEVILIFIFIVLIAVISFTLGVRIGKQLSLKQDNYTAADKANINLKSMEEEYVDTVVTDNGASSFEKAVDESNTQKVNGKEVTDTMETRLREEMEKLANENIIIDKPRPDEKSTVVVNSKNKVAENLDKPKNKYTGKYTIQLFSHQSQEMAQDFADGFILKGYDVIINEVVIPGKGKWYRVGIGLFDNVNSAKDYLDKEKKLFQQNKYLIRQI